MVRSLCLRGYHYPSLTFSLTKWKINNGRPVAWSKKQFDAASVLVSCRRGGGREGMRWDENVINILLGPLLEQLLLVHRSVGWSSRGGERVREEDRDRLRARGRDKQVGRQTNDRSRRRASATTNQRGIGAEAGTSRQPRSQSVEILLLLRSPGLAEECTHKPSLPQWSLLPHSNLTPNKCVTTVLSIHSSVYNFNR